MALDATEYYVWPLSSVRNANYQWTQSPANSNEYYLENSGGGQPTYESAVNGTTNVTEPAAVDENGADMTPGTVGSLGVGEWDWGDNETPSLGFNTVYVRLTDDTDPDTKAADFVQIGGSDSAAGTGASSTAWRTPEHAIGATGIAQDTTNGDRVNIKDWGTATVSAAMSLTSYGTPNGRFQFYMEGYTTAAGDGGIGTLSGGGSVGIWSDASSNDCNFVNLRMTNCGAATIFDANDRIRVHHCEIDNTSGDGIHVDIDSIVTDCHVHNIGGTGISADSIDCRIEGNYLKNDGGNTMNIGINIPQVDTVCCRNILSMGANNTTPIDVNAANCYVHHNSILASSSTANAIDCTSASADNITCHSNLIEGFNGTGGQEWEFQSVNYAAIFGGNSSFNSTAGTDPEESGIWIADEALGASPFDKSGSDTYANRMTYFAPVAAVQGTAWPTGNRLDRGAVQHADPAGGGGTDSILGIGNLNGGFAG